MRSRVFLFLFPMLLAFAQPAFARDGGTLDSILPEIRAQHPGRLSDAEPFTAQDGSTHYRIKWMTPEGRILYFDADARSGRYFNSRGDDGGGAQWRRGGDDDGPRWNNGSSGPDQGDDDGGRRSHWNGSSDHWNGGSGDWHGGGDNGWRNHDRGDGRGDWHGGQGSWGNRGGDWRGGHNGGDNGGRHHHGG